MTTQQKEKCFVYLRRSQDREDRQALSIDKQDEIVKRILAVNDFTPIYLPAESRTARKKGRPIFGDMVRRIESGEASYIAIWQPSRLSRNPVDAGTIIDLLDMGKLKGIYTPEKTFKNKTDDKFYLNFEFSMAKKNNDDLSDQVIEGFATKRAHGEYPGPAPLGYKNAIINAGHRNIVPDPVNAPLIKSLFQYASQGGNTLKGVVEYANSIGLRSKKGNVISDATIMDLLKRRTYTGVYKYGGGEWHQGTYEPLISVELYDAVQRAMGWVRGPRRTATTAGREYAYKGLMLCETCKFNITAYTKPKVLKSGANAEYIFYTCTKKNTHIECAEPQVSAQLIENSIISGLANHTISEHAGAECLKLVEAYHEDYISRQSSYLETWKHDLREAESKIDLLDEKLVNGTITDERYGKLVAKYEDTSHNLRHLIGSSGKDADLWLELAREVFSTSINLSTVFTKAEVIERRRLMMAVGSNWYLGNKKVTFTPRKPYDLLVKCDNDSSWRARPDLNRRSPP